MDGGTRIHLLWELKWAGLDPEYIAERVAATHTRPYKLHRHVRQLVGAVKQVLSAEVEGMGLSEE